MAQSIVPAKFNEVFKNAMRDYYTYGFKNYKDYKNSDREKSRSLNSVKSDWERLNNILGGYFEWSKNNNKVIFASKNTRFQEERENPLHKVFRYCHCKADILESYLIILFSLCPLVEKEMAGIFKDIDSYERVKKNKFKTSDLSAITEKDNLNSITNDLQKMGLIQLGVKSLLTSGYLARDLMKKK